MKLDHDSGLELPSIKGLHQRFTFNKQVSVPGVCRE